jgi:Cu(I)/Ag(I) efflux system membrane fusion protein
MPATGMSNTVPSAAKQSSNTTPSAPAEFVLQLNTAFDQYLAVKNALVQSNPAKAKAGVKDLSVSIAKINGMLLNGNARQQWTDLVNKMNSDLDKLGSSENISDQRLAFAALSKDLYPAIKLFGLQKRTVYYQFCPMFNKTGAYWLSESKEIRNPYYGEQMLTCGDTKEVMIF